MQSIRYLDLVGYYSLRYQSSRIVTSFFENTGNFCCSGGKIILQSEINVGDLVFEFTTPVGVVRCDILALRAFKRIHNHKNLIFSSFCFLANSHSIQSRFEIKSSLCQKFDHQQLHMFTWYLCIASRRVSSIFAVWKRRATNVWAHDKTKIIYMMVKKSTLSHPTSGQLHVDPDQLCSHCGAKIGFAW